MSLEHARPTAKVGRAAGGSTRRTIALWPDAGMQLGLSRNATYAAAARGEIPTLRFGKKIVVPLERFERLLGGE